MGIRQILLAAFALGALAMLVFLVRGTQSVDGDLHLERLALLQEIGNLDTALDRIVTLDQVASLSDAVDDRIRISEQLGVALDALEEGPLALRGINQELDQQLDVFQEVIGDKFALAFDFEARTSRSIQRLIRSMDSVPIMAGRLEAVTDDPEIVSLVSGLRYDIVTYALAPNPSERDIGTIDTRIAKLKNAEQNKPDAFREAAKRLRGSVSDVRADKGELVDRIDAFFAIPTKQTLQALEQTYTNHQETLVAEANQYRLWLAAYSAILLLVLAGLALRLRRSFRELDQANETLEEQVKGRTSDLSSALDNLKESQAQLIQSEKMASLGQMVAGVAHEINTPLGYARSNTEIIRSALHEIREVCAAQNDVLKLINSPEATDEQIATAVALAHALEAEIAPQDLAAELDTLLGDSEHGLAHITELVENLKDFSRVDRSRSDMFDINQGVQSTLKLCRNHIKDDTKVMRALGKLPPIECSPSQINQVLLNLLTNAAQAVGENGKIYVHTTAENNGVGIRILDNGCGMDEEVRSQVFDPFYTTKPIGEGTGLGLSISFRIIEDHHGSIKVKSIPGKGSEFIIWLPLKQPLPAASNDAQTPISEPALAAAGQA